MADSSTTYNRTNQNLHVRGYRERGNINTPLELAIENEIDGSSGHRYRPVPKLQAISAHAKEKLRNLQINCRRYAHEHGIDMPEINEWRWPVIISIADCQLAMRETR
jgi:xylulose-5-phosphate/fructose-6-phosphate phosphoketolase